MAFNVNQTKSPYWMKELDTKEGLLLFLKLMNEEIEHKAGEGSDAGLHGIALQRYVERYAGTRFCRHFKTLLERGNQIMLEPPYPKSGAHKQAIKERIAELERELGVVTT